MRGYKKLPLPTRPVSRKPASLSINTPSTCGTDSPGANSNVQLRDRLKTYRMVKNDRLLIDDSDSSLEDDPMSEKLESKKPLDTHWKKKPAPTVVTISNGRMPELMPKSVSEMNTQSATFLSEKSLVKSEQRNRTPTMRSPKDFSIIPTKRSIHMTAALVPDSSSSPRSPLVSSHFDKPRTIELVFDVDGMTAQSRRFVKQRLIEDDDEELYELAKEKENHDNEELIEIDLDSSLPLEDEHISPAENETKRSAHLLNVREISPELSPDLPRTVEWDYDMATSAPSASSLRPLFNPGTLPPSKPKPPKFLRNGLAHRLATIANSEQADRGFWKHSRSLSVLPPVGTPSTSQAYCLTLKVIDTDLPEFAFVCVRCAVVKSRGSYLPSESMPNTGTVCSALTEHGVEVFLPAPEAKKYDVQPGVTIRIFQPWRELPSANSTGSFILCPYFFLVLNKGGRSSTAGSVRI